jgi:hypothetical protein
MFTGGDADWVNDIEEYVGLEDLTLDSDPTDGTIGPKTLRIRPPVVSVESGHCRTGQVGGVRTRPPPGSRDTIQRCFNDSTHQ